MRKVEITLYTFNELAEEAQEKALEYFQDINVDFDWWDFTYDDAKTIGLQITEFSLDYNHIKGELIEPIQDVFNLIFENHGEDAATYQTAKAYRMEYQKTQTDAITNGENAEDAKTGYFSKADEIEDSFKKALLTDYLELLKHEYEYQTSEEAIKETIIVNEYEFTANGKLWRY